MLRIIEKYIDSVVEQKIKEQSKNFIKISNLEELVNAFLNDLCAIKDQSVATRDYAEKKLDKCEKLLKKEVKKNYKYKGKYMVAYSGAGTLKELHIYPNVFKTKEAVKNFMLERKKDTKNGTLIAYKVDLALEYETK